MRPALPIDLRARAAMRSFRGGEEASVPHEAGRDLPSQKGLTKPTPREKRSKQKQVGHGPLTRCHAGQIPKKATGLLYPIPCGSHDTPAMRAWLTVVAKSVSHLCRRWFPSKETWEASLSTVGTQNVPEAIHCNPIARVLSSRLWDPSLYAIPWERESGDQDSA